MSDTAIESLSINHLARSKWQKQSVNAILLEFSHFAQPRDDTAYCALPIMITLPSHDSFPLAFLVAVLRIFLP